MNATPGKMRAVPPRLASAADGPGAEEVVEYRDARSGSSNVPNFLEQLVAEWYEYRGFFVRRNVNVGKRTAGGHEGELDVVAFHPVEKLLVQIETSMDAESWAQIGRA